MATVAVFNCKCGNSIIADPRLQMRVRFPDGHIETLCRRGCPEMSDTIARRNAAEMKVSRDSRAAEAARNEAMRRRSDAAVARNGATLRLAVATLPIGK